MSCTFTSLPLCRMTSLEYHLLTIAAPPAPARALALPLLPGAALALHALRRHHPRALALHYWADAATLVTLPIRRAAALDQVTGRLELAQELHFILPSLDPGVTYLVTEGEELQARVEELEEQVEEQEQRLVHLQAAMVHLSPLTKRECSGEWGGAWGEQLSSTLPSMAQVAGPTLHMDTRVDKQTIQEIVSKIETKKKEEGAMIQEIVAKIESKKKEDDAMIQGIVAKLETRFAEKPVEKKEESEERKEAGKEVKATGTVEEVVKKQENSKTKKNAQKDENDNILPSLPDDEHLADTQGTKPMVKEHSFKDVKDHEEGKLKDKVDRKEEVKDQEEVTNNEIVDEEEKKDNEKVKQDINSTHVEGPRGVKEVEMVSIRPKLGRGRGRKVLVASSAVSPYKTVG